MYASDAVLLVVVFIGTQIWGFFGHIPGTMIDPRHSTIQRFFSSFQLTGTLYAIQHINLRIHPDPEFITLGELKEMRRDPLLPELDSIMQRAMDNFLRNQNDSSPGTFAVKRGNIIVDDHPVIRALNGFFEKLVHPGTPGFVTVWDVAWTVVFWTIPAVMLSLLVLRESRKRAGNRTVSDDGGTLNSSFEKFHVFVEQKLQEFSSQLQDAIRNGNGNDNNNPFATDLESLSDSPENTLQEDMNAHLEQKLQPERRTIRNRTSDDTFLLHFKAFHDSLGKLLQENVAIRQELETISSGSNCYHSVQATMQEIKDAVVSRVQEVIQTEFQKIFASLGALWTSNIGSSEIGDHKDSGDGLSGPGIFRDALADFRAKFTDVYDSISSIPALVKESLDALHHARPSKETTEALDHIQSHVDEQLQALIKRIDSLESGSSSDTKQIHERVSELGSQLVKFRKWLEDIQDGRSATVHMIHQLENQLNGYMEKWNTELEKVKVTVTQLESQSGLSEQSLFVSQENYDKGLCEVKNSISTLSEEFDATKKLCHDLQENSQNPPNEQASQNEKFGELQKTVTETVSATEDQKTKHASLEALLNVATETSERRGEKLAKVESLVQEATAERKKTAERLTRADSLIQSGTEQCDGREERLKKVESLIQETTQGQNRTADELTKSESFIQTAMGKYDSQEKGLVKAEPLIQKATEDQHAGKKLTNAVVEALEQSDERLTKLGALMEKAKKDHSKNPRRSASAQSIIETNTHSMERPQTDVGQRQKQRDLIADDDDKNLKTYAPGERAAESNVHGGGTSRTSGDLYLGPAAPWDNGSGPSTLPAKKPTPSTSPLNPNASEFIVPVSQAGAASPGLKPISTKSGGRLPAERPGLNPAAAEFTAQISPARSLSSLSLDPDAREFIPAGTPQLQDKSKKLAKAGSKEQETKKGSRDEERSSEDSKSTNSSDSSQAVAATENISRRSGEKLDWSEEVETAVAWNVSESLATLKIPPTPFSSPRTPGDTRRAAKEWNEFAGEGGSPRTPRRGMPTIGPGASHHQKAKHEPTTGHGKIESNVTQERHGSDAGKASGSREKKGKNSVRDSPGLQSSRWATVPPSNEPENKLPSPQRGKPAGDNRKVSAIDSSAKTPGNKQRMQDPRDLGTSVSEQLPGESETKGSRDEISISRAHKDDEPGNFKLADEEAEKRYDELPEQEHMGLLIHALNDRKFPKLKDSRWVTEPETSDTSPSPSQSRRNDRLGHNPLVIVSGPGRGTGASLSTPAHTQIVQTSSSSSGASSTTKQGSRSTGSPVSRPTTNTNPVIIKGAAPQGISQSRWAPQSSEATPRGTPTSATRGRGQETASPALSQSRWATPAASKPEVEASSPLSPGGRGRGSLGRRKGGGQSG